MNYITHHRYKATAICGKQLNLPYGTELQTNGQFITTLEGDVICCTTSENAKLHFARNDDGQGLERGKLTYAIAYAKRGNGQRFTEEEREMLARDWSKYLRQDTSTVLFNDAFFNAEIQDLQELAKALSIKVKR